MNAENQFLQILLVEDNPAEALLLRELLSEIRTPLHRVIHLTRLDDAMARLSSVGADAILLDLSLPDVRGLETVVRMRRAAPGVPIVVLTGLDDDAVALQAVQNGAQDYLVKGSVDTEALRRAIRHAIERQRNMEQLQILNARLERLALVDPLTELLNRRGLEQVLQNESERARRAGWELIVLLIDLDDFKKINSAFGHAAGDVALKQVAVRISSCLRCSDSAARVGGDEFMVVLTETNLGSARKVAERIRMAVEAIDIHLTDQSFKVTCSVGVAVVPNHSPLLIDELLTLTCQPLQAGKVSGKNRIVLAGENAAGDPREVDPRLVRFEGFYAVSLPVHDLLTGSVVGFELLSRGPRGLLENPIDFFSLCVRENILTQVDLKCLRMCLEASASLDPKARLHLNVFPSTLLAVPPLHLVEILRAAPGGRPCVLEISEQQVIGDPSCLREPVEALRAAGVGVALDDVGFGRTFLESLVLLSPDLVKIDRRLVHGIARNPAQARALKRLLAVLAAVGAEVIAEGIESREDLEELARAGIRHGQGLLWGPPQPVGNVALPARTPGATA